MAGFPDVKRFSCDCTSITDSSIIKSGYCQKVKKLVFKYSSLIPVKDKLIAQEELLYTDL